MFQNNLGNALTKLGERTNDAATLARAIAAYEAVLEERTRERSPHDWAYTQENLAEALLAIVLLGGDAGRLQEALAVVDGALAVYRPENAAYDIGTAEELRGRIVAALKSHPV